jgi:hypothetical protein
MAIQARNDPIRLWNTGKLAKFVARGPIATITWTVCVIGLVIFSILIDIQI